MSDRFTYYPASQRIKDNLTGYTYFSNIEICKLLNEINNRADLNTEKYYKCKQKKENKKKNR